MNYQIDYEIEGRVKTQCFDAHDVGQAYQECLKAYPEAKIVAGHLYRKWADVELYMNYQPVFTGSPEPLPKEKNRVQSEMELDDVRKPKPKRGRSSPVSS